MEHPFGLRFSYVRWLRHLVDGEAPAFAEIGRAVERTGPAVGAWVRLKEAPGKYQLHEALAAFLDVDERWLVRGEGEAPRDDLWKEWVRHRRADPKIVPKGATKQITRADIAAAKKAAKRSG